MTTATGSSGIVKVATFLTTQQVVGEIRSFTIEDSADTIENSVMGDLDRTYRRGLGSSTISIEAYFDPSDAGQVDMLAREKVDFEISPMGTGSGTRVFSGTGIVTSRTVNSSFDGMVEASFSIQVSGALTVGTN